MTKKTLVRELLETAKELNTIIAEIKESFDFSDVMDLDEEEFNFLRDFFKDYNSSYSLSLAYPESLWKITAESIGLETEGKDRLQLAKEIFTKMENPEKTDAKDTNTM